MSDGTRMAKRGAWGWLIAGPLGAAVGVITTDTRTPEERAAAAARAAAARKRSTLVALGLLGAFVGTFVMLWAYVQVRDWWHRDDAANVPLYLQRPRAPALLVPPLLYVDAPVEPQGSGAHARPSGSRGSLRRGGHAVAAHRVATRATSP